ncbi:acyltransferase family protein [Rhodopseudomonas palustris]|uniref:acyltransferase family protein n=1 Tax=Rhodopseudomonas palustris TaxID=1076 RepID=UPI0005A2FDFE|nr:acyltransferase [Rhodopseudomonas palustris]
MLGLLKDGRAKKMIGRNSALDGLRGVAVMLTYFVHYCGSYMAIFRGGNPNSVDLSGWYGAFDVALYVLFRSHHGVYLFFMLSGFLIARITLAGKFDYSRFVLRRIMRIYPAFLLAVMICALVGLVLHIPLPNLRVIAANLVFLNGVPSLGISGIVFNNVTWSLFYEMTFYFMFPIAVITAQAFSVPVIGAVALSGVVVAYVPSVIGFYAEFYLFLFFGALIGCLSKEQVGSIASSFPDSIIVIMYIVVVGLMVAGYLSTSQFVWLFSVLGSAILCKAIVGEGWLVGLLSWRPLVFLGRISYSFYLLHSVALSLVFAGWWHVAIVRFGVVFDALFIAGVGFCGAVGLGWLSYVIAESFYFRINQPVAVGGVSNV